MALVVGLNWLGLSTISGTVAFYFDSETSTGNLFDAALLDFELSSPGDFAPEVSNEDDAERQISVTDVESIAFHYRVRAENFAGPLCDVLNFEAFLKNDLKYSGPLIDFEAGDFDFAQPEDWDYIASLTSNDSIFFGTTCEFDLVHSGWQIQFPIIFSGFHDIETIPSIITAAGPTCVTADFETDAEGNAILKGQIIDDEYASLGLNISAENNRGSHPDLAIIFDSDAPTGGDIDLGTPNEDFAGPGVGTGGELGEPGENAVPQHNILIIAENDSDENNDGLVDIPDDEVRGGSIWFVFGEETLVEDIRIIDIEEDGAEINLYDAGDINFETIDIPNLGDNSAQTVGVNKDGIKKLEVVFPSSGALDDICFEPTQERPSNGDPTPQTPTGTQSDGDVVLNEILPNPEGLDNQEELLGEWVELYNNGDTSVDVVGWKISELADPGGSATEKFYTIVASSPGAGEVKIFSGSTVITPGGFLVIVFDAARLNNNGDTVALYNFGDELKDSHTFGVSSNDEDDDSANTPGEGNEPVGGSEEAANEGKSIARIPDGTGAWIDPVPTPGKPNKLEENPQVGSSTEQTDEDIPLPNDTDIDVQAETSSSTDPSTEGAEASEPLGGEEDASSTPSTEQPVEEIVEEDPSLKGAETGPSPEGAEASEEPQEEPPLLPEARIVEEEEEEPEEEPPSNEE